MMDHFFLVCTSDFYYNNRIFDLDSSYNRDNYYYPFHYFKKKLAELSISIDTYDFFDKTKNEKYGLIFFDMPDDIEKYIDDSNCLAKYLVIWESEVIRPTNWNKKDHMFFDKIFTWNDEYVDNIKYFKINFSHKIGEEIVIDLSKKSKLCTMISAHKFRNHPLELYSERLKTIRWFEQNHPEDFDLYGMDWDKFRFKGAFSPMNHIIDRFKILNLIFKPDFPSYMGKVRSKNETYGKYKFAICYENARDISGYITEKIFDCFYGACVPIYWGPENITEHIPANTFINRHDFETYDELYNTIKHMDDEEYKGYLEAIKNFIKSDEIHQFSSEYFAEILISNIVE
ncbi:glycosyltransferase family 10 domain-containing protein [uncultured Methanolobus sp.]|uniref:glycosyltransferase family 10 domain-containing protein n=1 Tax=uncultured Methanolobus sp. TaxID=218300 RepID=UPI002AAC3E5B|nr:glycosyltransferase family 10 [uncultured Methanolobus sp.]